MTDSKEQPAYRRFRHPDTGTIGYIDVEPADTRPSAAPVAEPVAWIAFGSNGNIRFWTSDPERAKREKQRGLDQRAFTLSELIALVSRSPVPVADVAGAVGVAPGHEEIAAKIESRARKFLDEMRGAVSDSNAAGYEVIPADIVGGYWKEDAEIDLLAADALRRSGVQSRDDDWQPIETAPKDGTDILVWPYWSDRQPAQVHWRDLQRKPGRWEITPSFYCAGAKPTHWQQLPAAPSLSSAQSKCEGK